MVARTTLEEVPGSALHPDLWAVCFSCMLNFSLVNSPRVTGRCVRNWLKILTNKIVYVELFLLLPGKALRIRDILLPAEFSACILFHAFGKGLSLNEGLHSVTKFWLSNNQRWDPHPYPNNYALFSCPYSSLNKSDRMTWKHRPLPLFPHINEWGV